VKHSGGGGRGHAGFWRSRQVFLWEHRYEEQGDEASEKPSKESRDCLQSPAFGHVVRDCAEGYAQAQANEHAHNADDYEEGTAVQVHEIRKSIE
jgi:hypothetical protein